MRYRQIMVALGLCILGAVGTLLAMACFVFLADRSLVAALSEEVGRASDVQSRMGGGGRHISSVQAFGTVFNQIQYNCRGRRLNDERLKDMVGLRAVVGLDLSDNPITDDGLRYVAEVPHLQWLQLSGTQITDDGLRYLEKLEHLRVLDLSDTQITQEAASHLAKIKLLDAVYASGTSLRSVQGAAVDINTKSSASWIDGRTVWPLPLPQN